MSFEDIRGQGEAIRRLEGALSGGRLAHAVLLAGPEGVGKRKAAFEVARALLCESGPGRACGRCGSCRRAEAGTHADMYLVEPDGKGAGIGIDKIRDLSRRISQSPMEGRRKAAIIDAADSMTPQAQNSLLKTLEEPPADTTILLVAENADLLLPTVRSRCRRVNFAPVGDEVIGRFLVENGVAEETARALAPLAGGSFSQALALAADPSGESRRRLLELIAPPDADNADELAEMIAPGTAGAGGHAAGGLRQRRERAAGMLGTLHSFLTDCLRVKSGAAAGANADVEGAVRAFAGAREFEELADLEKEVADAIILLGMYADVRLAAGRAAAAFSRRQTTGRA